LDAKIGHGGRTIALVHLTRPRSACPFTVDDVQHLDQLRPWLAHLFHQAPPGDAPRANEDLLGAAGASVLSGQMVLTADARIVFETESLESLLQILAGEPANYTQHLPPWDKLPARISRLHQQIVGAANGTSRTMHRMQISTTYGVLTLEAKWLMPAGAVPADVAKDPKGCLIAVTVELRQHAVAHAARILRESGVTPTQLKVGIQLAFGKTKTAIADELGIRLTSVVDLTRKLYRDSRHPQCRRARGKNLASRISRRQNLNSLVSASRKFLTHP
jgi:hypothetical protein